jgi:phosphopantothenoylcysteine decarboxylase
MLQAIADARDLHTTHREHTSHDAVVRDREDGKKHLLLAATGSVATIKSVAPSLASFSVSYPPSRPSFPSNSSTTYLPTYLPTPSPLGVSARPLTRLARIPEIIRALARHSPGTLSIRVVFTRTARHFLQGQSHEQPLGSSLRFLPNVDGVYDDDSEWGPTQEPWKRGRPILHIELRKCMSPAPPG